MSEQDFTITREFAAPARFVIDEGFSDEEGDRLTAQDYGMTDDMPSEDRVTVTLEERDGRTRMTMCQAILRDVAERNGAPRGWRETFDKLDSCLSELQRGTGLAH